MLGHKFNHILQFIYQQRILTVITHQQYQQMTHIQNCTSYIYMVVSLYDPYCWSLPVSYFVTRNLADSTSCLHLIHCI